MSSSTANLNSPGALLFIILSPNYGDIRVVPALPPVIESIRQGHITTAQATAVVAALFAGLQGQLLSSIPNDKATPLLKALHLFGYGGLVLNIGASLSAMYLLDVLGEVPEQFWRLSQQPELLNKEHSDFDLLKSYGGSSKMSNIYTHCHISLIVGASSLLLEIALLAWLNSDSVAIFVLIIVSLFWVCLLYPGQIVFAFFTGFFEEMMKGRRQRLQD